MKISRIVYPILILAMPSMSIYGQDSRRYGSPEYRDIDISDNDGKLSVGFSLIADNLDIPSSEAVILTPCYVGADTVYLPSFTLCGRNNFISAQRRGKVDEKRMFLRNNGKPQAIPYQASVAMPSEAAEASLVILEDYCGCGASLGSSDGTVIAKVDFTPLAEPSPIYASLEKEASAAVIELSGSAFVDFPVNVTKIIPGYRDNRKELQKIIMTIDTVSNLPNASITGIDIHGYASPEGSYSHNTALARDRALALKNYVQSIASYPDTIFSVTSTPENWDGLRRLVAQSKIPEKDSILALSDSDLSPDIREAMLRNRFPEAYRIISRDILPALRVSDYKVTYTVAPLPPEKVREILLSEPSRLTIADLFTLAMTYPEGSDEYADIMMTAATLFPANTTAQLNAAACALERGDTATADRHLARSGDSPEAIHARTVAEYLKKAIDRKNNSNITIITNKSTN